MKQIKTMFKKFSKVYLSTNYYYFHIKITQFKLYYFKLSMFNVEHSMYLL